MAILYLLLLAVLVSLRWFVSSRSRSAEKHLETVDDRRKRLHIDSATIKSPNDVNFLRHAYRVGEAERWTAFS